MNFVTAVKNRGWHFGPCQLLISFIGDLTDETKFFLHYNMYLTLISHHAKGDPRKALMKADDLKYRQVLKTTAYIRPLPYLC